MSRTASSSGSAHFKNQPGSAGFALWTILNDLLHESSHNLFLQSYLDITWI